MSDFSREVVFEPGWDKREAGAGQHGADMVFVLKGELGTVTWKTFTMWLLPGFRKDLEQSGIFSLPPPLPVGVWVHCKHSHPTEQEMHASCPYLDGNLACHLVLVGYITADVLFDMLVEKGSDEVWKAMENIYRDTIQNRSEEANV